MTNAARWWVVLCVGAVALSACTTASQRAQPPPPRPITGAPRAEAGKTPAPAMTEITLEDEDKKPPRPNVEMYPGTGTFVNPKAVAPRPPDTGGEYTLNFEATDLQEVVKVVIGDLLKESYFIDPKVTGQVTIQTSRPLKRAELLPTLENLLRLNGAVLLRSDGLYKVMPGAQATRGSPPASVQRVAAARGYGIRVVPLRFVSARELHKLIEPFLPPDAPQIVDEQRNLLILTGTEQELESTMELVEIFDVDWLNGMSVGLFKLKDAEVKTLHAEMEKIFGDKDSPVSGVVRMVPVERLNALLVVTSRPDYLEHAREWVERLDQVADAVGPRLFVYRVQNGKAADLATVLGGIFGAEATKEGGPPAAELAPGEEPTTLDSGDPRTSEREGDLGGEEMGGGKRRTGKGSKEPAVSVVSTENLKIIADESTNALVILARTQDYKMIETALKNLDVVPLQVLIEASVIEVTLNDNLSYGVEWFFRHSVREDTAVGTLDLAGAAGLAALGAPNFSYALFADGGRVRAVINAIASESKLNVLSSPSLMVLDNQTATIEVATDVPITTGQQQAVLDTGGVDNIPNVLASVDFRKAGVILEVTPRVNASGRITLDLSQEVSDPIPPAPGAPGGNPSFLERKVETSVTVQSGETLVIGGLIGENKSDSETGIPFLKDMPVLGGIFGSTSDTLRRTELLVLLTPKAVRDQGEARAVTKEFRERLKELEKAGPGEVRRGPGRP
ncbi:MAG: type II secretion system secretin GspD [Pseudomonadota bacterium]|nr:type II secretion system secretin GspD [Pseudomonadota bacterium]